MRCQSLSEFCVSSSMSPQNRLLLMYRLPSVIFRICLLSSVLSLRSYLFHKWAVFDTHSHRGFSRHAVRDVHSAKCAYHPLIYSPPTPYASALIPHPLRSMLSSMYLTASSLLSSFHLISLPAFLHPIISHFPFFFHLV